MAIKKAKKTLIFIILSAKIGMIGSIGRDPLKFKDLMVIPMIGAIKRTHMGTFILPKQTNLASYLPKRVVMVLVLYLRQTLDQGIQFLDFKQLLLNKMSKLIFMLLEKITLRLFCLISYFHLTVTN